jgi:DNA-binding MarR family transcriptional regulator
VRGEANGGRTASRDQRIARRVRLPIVKAVRTAAEVAAIDEADDAGRNHGLLIRLAGRAFTRILQTVIKDYDMTAGEFRILRTVGSAPGSTQNEIADFAAMDRPYVAALLKRLRARKFVTTVADGADRRRRNFALTVKGNTLRSDVLARITPTAEIAERGISKRELEIYQRVIRRMTQSVDRYYETLTSRADD